MWLGSRMVEKVPRCARDDGYASNDGHASNGGYAMFSTIAFPNSLVLSSVAPAINRSKS